MNFLALSSGNRNRSCCKYLLLSDGGRQNLLSGLGGLHSEPDLSIWLFFEFQQTKSKSTFYNPRNISVIIQKTV